MPLHGRRGRLPIKLLIEQSLECKEVEVRITCGLMDERLKHLIEQIKLYAFSVVAQKDGVTIPIALEQIYYFEAVDSKVFLYTEKETFSCEKKLYELEELLIETPFVRISKSCIINTSLVLSVKAYFSGRLEVMLRNDEKLLISKHYAQDFKAKFMK